MSSDLVIGALFGGRYRVEAQIAAGGMGAVYEVTHVETGRRRALKVMHSDLVQNEEFRERFRQEARVAAQIDSDFIVDVFDAGIDEDTRMPFLVMEMLRGEPISKRVRRAGRLPPQEALTFLYQTALALDKTHKARIVHRDLKPENLFVCDRDDGPPRIKVLDFGIAKLLAENSLTVNATRTVGTPIFMAPEQFAPDSVVSPATDLYALAMIAYMLLVGRSYWSDELKEAPNVFALAEYVNDGPVEPATARALRRGVTLPPGFDAWFTRATAKEPADRFPTATESITALTREFGLSPVSLVGGMHPGMLSATGENPRASLPDDAPTAPSPPEQLSSSGPVAFGAGSSEAPGQTLHAGEMTQSTLWRRKRPAFLVGGAVAACLVLVVLYAALSSGGSGTGVATQPEATQAVIAPSVSPSGSTSAALTVSPSASAEEPMVLPATTIGALPKTSQTAAPRPTSSAAATSKQGRWIRD